MLSVLFRLSVALGQKRSSSSLETSSIPHSHRQRREAENTPLTQVFAFQYQCQNPRQLIKRRPTRLTKGMAIYERDIWRAANLLIEQHGSDAASTAIQRARSDARSGRERRVAGVARIRLAKCYRRRHRAG